jgi:aryl-alcohol dehydrogenase-like predicted oxidoreductase
MGLPGGACLRNVKEGKERNSLKKRMLRDIEVSEVGMGCMAFSHGYGKIPEEKYSIEAIQNAYNHGCTFFDTAEVYSPNLAGIGHNELIVGKALKDVREDVVIATKLMLHGFSVGSVYKTIRKHLEGSLDRLQTDYVDIYYLHRMSGVPVEKVAEAMGRLMDDGLIRGWGLSQVDVDIIDRAQQVTPLAAIQNIYSMVERDSEAEIILTAWKTTSALCRSPPDRKRSSFRKDHTRTQFREKRRCAELGAPAVQKKHEGQPADRGDAEGLRREKECDTGADLPCLGCFTSIRT